MMKAYKLATQLYTGKRTQADARNEILEKMSWVIIEQQDRRYMSQNLFTRMAKLYFSL